VLSKIYLKKAISVIKDLPEEQYTILASIRGWASV